jgi:predicted SAM-dependent methyltransferase
MLHFSIMDFSNTRISRDRSIMSYSKVGAVVSVLRRNRGFQAWGLPTSDYLNAGVGPNLVPGFINLDYNWHPGIHLCWDLTKPLPIADRALKGVFTEHCLEHFSLEQGRSILSEFHRILRPGGIVRVIVPDVELYIRSYTQALAGEPVDFPYAESYPVSSPIHYVNRVMRLHGHLYGYDFLAMKGLLEQTGFSDVKRESYGQGRDPHLLIDQQGRQVESLYVEAVA